MFREEAVEEPGARTFARVPSEVGGENPLTEGIEMTFDEDDDGDTAVDAAHADGGSAARGATRITVLVGAIAVAIAVIALAVVMTGGAANKTGEVGLLTPLPPPPPTGGTPPPPAEKTYTPFALVEAERTAFPHDASGFTQGYEYVDAVDLIVEGTGLNGQSVLKVVEPTTGATVGDAIELDRKYFGEGITLVPETNTTGTIYQLTWKSRVLFVYSYELQAAVGDAPAGIDIAYERTEEFPPTQRGEGWGICNNGTHFFVSDGSQYLHVWSVAPMREVARVAVLEDGSPRMSINELECLPAMVDGQAHTDILANVWHSDVILRIDATTGAVVEVYDMTQLAAAHRREGVLNGIAYSAAQRAVYVTGKKWSTVYRYPLRVGGGGAIPTPVPSAPQGTPAPATPVPPSEAPSTQEPSTATPQTSEPPQALPETPAPLAPTPEPPTPAPATPAPSLTLAGYTAFTFVEDGRVDYPHDASGFTQGYEYVDAVDLIVEGTGLNGQSVLKVVEPTTGATVGDAIELDRKYFGEGITLVPETNTTGTIYQLTWKSRVLFVYSYELQAAVGDAPAGIDIAYERTEEFPPTQRGEGWGICNNGTHFFVSDGSQYLHVWSVAPMREVARVAVYREGGAGRQYYGDINELECLPAMVDGQAHTDILANVWHSDVILRIDATTGVVVEVYDMTQLAAAHRREGVLNGIAYSAAQRAVYVTGKKWSTVYRYPLRVGDGGAAGTEDAPVAPP